MSNAKQQPFQMRGFGFGSQPKPAPYAMNNMFLAVKHQVQKNKNKYPFSAVNQELAENFTEDQARWVCIVPGDVIHAMELGHIEEVEHLHQFDPTNLNQTIQVLWAKGYQLPTKHSFLAFLPMPRGIIEMVCVSTEFEPLTGFEQLDGFWGLATLDRYKNHEV